MTIQVVTCSNLRAAGLTCLLPDLVLIMFLSYLIDIRQDTLIAYKLELMHNTLIFFHFCSFVMIYLAA